MMDWSGEHTSVGENIKMFSPWGEEALYETQTTRPQ